MKATLSLHELGQSLWLDNITRDLLDTGTLERYIGDLAVLFLMAFSKIVGFEVRPVTDRSPM